MTIRAHIERRAEVRACGACGIVTDDPRQHKTWCDVYRAATQRFVRGADLTGRAA